MPEVEDPNLFGDEIDEEEEDEEYEDEIYDDDEEEKPKPQPQPQLPKRKHEEEAAAAAHAAKPPIPQNPNPNFSSTIVVSSVHSLSSHDHKHQKTSSASAAAAADVEDSRRIFQRLWTDEDEIGLLQGFLEYTSQRGRGRGVFHHDTAPFYDQIKTRLQLDFNKNQLVEKLRRLKKKYRNVVNRIGSGKDFSFKSPHEQATFEISRKIWSTAASAPVDEDEDGNSHPNAGGGGGGNKVPRSRRRGRKRLDDVSGGHPHPPPQSAAAMEDNLPNFPHSTPPSAAPAGAANPNVTNVIEDTVRSCLSPLFKELLYCAINGPCNSAVGGVALNPLPLNFGGNSVNLSSSEAVDERWRKQQILELEVYSKRLELVQEQIKSALEELRSMGS